MTCDRCGADADGKVKYEFEDGYQKYSYCQDCATTMHERYTIDDVVSGDLEL